MTEPFRVLGIPVQTTRFDDAVASLAAAPAEGRRIAAHFATAHMLVESDGDPRLQAVLRDDLVFPDGVPLVWLARLAGRKAERVCGPDTMPALIARTAGTGLGHFFYGGGPGVPEALAERFAAQHPGVRIAGTYSPPFRALSPVEDREVVERINASGADFVWVGLGSPKQDLWVHDHRDALNAAVLLAVGAAFDFAAGRTRRAPRWMQRWGLEWLFRLASEPRRLLKRYTVVNARFFALLVREALGRPRTQAAAAPDGSLTDRASRR